MIPSVDALNKAQQPAVAIYRPVDGSGKSHRQLEGAGYRVHLIEDGEDLGQALGSLGPVHALLAASLRGNRLDGPRFDALPELRIVSKYTIGVDDVDLEAATERGILVTHCPTEANFGGVAEGTLAFALALLKQLVPRDRTVRSGLWRSESLNGVYLGSRTDGYAGITFGIIGLGRIGRRVADLLAPFRLRVIAADPYVETEVFSRHGVEAVELDDLLRRADVVSVHCQLTAETDGLIDASRLKLAKPSAILINTARGRIVDVDAVCDALDAGRLAGAAFDVLPEEPPPAGARILAIDERVLLSPHMVAANQGGTLGPAIPWATAAVFDALDGRVPERICNEAAIDAWRARFAGVPVARG